MKDSKIKIILTTILIGLLIIVMIIKGRDLIKTNKISNNDSIKFKEEYESLNGKYDNVRERKYLDVNISSDNPVKYATFTEISDLIDHGTGVIYFGFPECPWCRNAVPVLLEAAETTGVDTIYYFNALDIRDEKFLDANGEIVTTKEGTKEYKQLLKKLDKYLSVYSGLNDDSIKRLYFPTVFFIKEGVVIGNHIGTVDSHTDSKVKLNSEQKLELKNIYEDFMMKVLDSSCDKEC